METKNSIGISSNTTMETKKEFIPLLQQSFRVGRNFSDGRHRFNWSTWSTSRDTVT